MEEREIGVSNKQLLRAACAHVKLLEGRLAGGNGPGPPGDTPFYRLDRQTDRQTDRHVYLKSYTTNSTSPTISK